MTEQRFSVCPIECPLLSMAYISLVRLSQFRCQCCVYSQLNSKYYTTMMNFPTDVSYFSRIFFSIHITFSSHLFPFQTYPLWLLTLSQSFLFLSWLWQFWEILVWYFVAYIRFLNRNMSTMTFSSKTGILAKKRGNANYFCYHNS